MQQKLTTTNILTLKGKEIFWFTSQKPCSYNLQKIVNLKNFLTNSDPIEAVAPNNLRNDDLSNANIVGTFFSLTNDPNDTINYLLKDDYDTLLDFTNAMASVQTECGK